MVLKSVIWYMYSGVEVTFQREVVCCFRRLRDNNMPQRLEGKRSWLTHTKYTASVMEVQKATTMALLETTAVVRLQASAMVLWKASAMVP